MRARELPPSRFRHESGSYGSLGRGYMPSILCCQQLEVDRLTEYSCLVKPDVVLEDEDAAAMAGEAANAARADLGSPQDFALSLGHDGYKSISDFRVVPSENR